MSPAHSSSGHTSVVLPFFGSRYVSINTSFPLPVVLSVEIGPLWDQGRFVCTSVWMLGSLLTCQLPDNIYGTFLSLNFRALRCAASTDSLNISAPYIRTNTLRLAITSDAVTTSSDAASLSTDTNDGTYIKFQAGNIGAALYDISPFVVYYGPSVNPFESVCTKSVMFNNFDASTGLVWVYCFTNPGWGQNLVFSVAVGRDGNLYTGKDTFSYPAGPTITGVSCSGESGCKQGSPYLYSSGGILLPTVVDIPTAGEVVLTITGTRFTPTTSAKIAGQVCYEMAYRNGKQWFFIVIVFLFSSISRAICRHSFYLQSPTGIWKTFEYCSPVRWHEFRPCTTYFICVSVHFKHTRLHRYQRLNYQLQPLWRRYHNAIWIQLRDNWCSSFG